MKALQSRKTALILMAILIVGAVLFGSHRSLSALKNQVDSAFRMGVEGDGRSILSDLEKRDSIAYNLTVVALRYYHADDPAILAVQQARDTLSKAKTPGEKAEADRVLGEAVASLQQQLLHTEMEEQDEKYPPRLYSDFLSRGHMIKTDPYNALAEEYNQALKQFPASLLAPLTGVTPVELYQ